MLAQNLAGSSDLEPFCDRFTGLAARDWLRHRARKIEDFVRLTTAFRGSGTVKLARALPQFCER
jgi:hypothetical protein